MAARSLKFPTKSWEAPPCLNLYGWILKKMVQIDVVVIENQLALAQPTVAAKSSESLAEALMITEV